VTRDGGRDAGRDARFAIVRATFYEDIAERLTSGALRALSEDGVGQELVDVYDVPGAFELPLAAKACARSGRYAGVICLGAVIRGETDHYEHVCAAAAHGIEQAGLETGVPCAFGVLTVDNPEQALARSGGGKRDQGWSSARTAVRMAKLLTRLDDPDGASAAKRID
jgi:6,7-dimethyl-8-ribityllumazine synthase